MLNRLPYPTLPYPTLLAVYGTRLWREADLAILPSYAQNPLTTLLSQPIAEDFQLLSPAALHQQRNVETRPYGYELLLTRNEQAFFGILGSIASLDLEVIKLPA